MKLFPRSAAGFATVLVGSLMTVPAFAQQRTSYASQATQYGSGSGGRLPFSGNSGGQGGMGNAYGGGNGYGGGMGMGGSSMGGNNSFGGGNNGFGGNGSIGSNTNGTTFAQNAFGNQSAFGNGRGGGQQFQQGGFVGRDASDVRAGFQGTERVPGQGGMLDQMIDNLNDMRESRRRWREQRNAPPPIRVKLVPGFEPPAPSAVRAAPAVQTRINHTLAAHAMTGAQIQISGQTATLRGSVNSPHEAALAEQLALLEPGISQVQNQLTVAPQAAP